MFLLKNYNKNIKYNTNTVSIISSIQMCNIIECDILSNFI